MFRLVRMAAPTPGAGRQPGACPRRRSGAALPQEHAWRPDAALQCCPGAVGWTMNAAAPAQGACCKRQAAATAAARCRPRSPPTLLPHVASCALPQLSCCRGAAAADGGRRQRGPGAGAAGPRLRCWGADVRLAAAVAHCAAGPAPRAAGPAPQQLATMVALLLHPRPATSVLFEVQQAQPPIMRVPCRLPHPVTAPCCPAPPAAARPGQHAGPEQRLH